MVSEFLIFAAAMAAQSEPLAAAPDVEDKTNFILCGCAKAPAPDAILEGLVIDAEMTLDASGRSPNERQATIFNVLKATGDNLGKAVEGRIRVFHNTRPASCGVTFDYGRRYSVAVRRTEAGVLETDLCLSAMKETEPQGSMPADENAPKSE